MLLLILLTSALIIDLRASFFNMAANDSICISESLPLHAGELELTNASHLWSKKEYLMMQKKKWALLEIEKRIWNDSLAKSSWLSWTSAWFFTYPGIW